MRIFKKFTDFCGGFAAGSAILYLFCQFMAFSPAEDVGLMEKAKLFLTPTETHDYRAYLLMIALFCLSLFGSFFFKRLPSLAFTISLLPLVRIFAMATESMIYERPMLYVVLGILHAAGGFCACIDTDRQSRSRHSAMAANGAAVVTALTALYIRYRFTSFVPDSEKPADFFDEAIGTARLAAEEGLFDLNLSVFVTIACILAALSLVNLLFGDLYFIDALLSLIPLGYTLYLWFGNRIPVHGNVLILMVILTTVCRIAVMLSCPARPRKTRKTIKN